MLNEAETTEPRVSAAQMRHEELHSSFGAVIKSSTSSPVASRLGEAWQRSNDLRSLAGTLENRREMSVLLDAVTQYELALHLLVCGQYRNAFVLLRYFLEQALRAVWLSANEVALRQWLNGIRDISWSTMTDMDGSGVFSKPFVNAFFPELSSESKHMSLLASTLYRECSEFIHGNSKPAIVLPSDVQFSIDVFTKGLDSADTAMLVVFFSVAVRYIKDLSREELTAIEKPLLDHLGHLESLREMYNDVSIGE